MLDTQFGALVQQVERDEQLVPEQLAVVQMPLEHVRPELQSAVVAQYSPELP